jgi:DNA repair protein RadC
MNQLSFHRNSHFCAQDLAAETISKNHETAFISFYCKSKYPIGIARTQPGTISKIHVPVRELVQLAIKINAHSVIVSHNHPSGIAYPSYSDIEQTRILYRALKAINVTLHDHIIFASDRRFSFRGVGLM